MPRGRKLGSKNKAPLKPKEKKVGEAVASISITQDELNQLIQTCEKTGKSRREVLMLGVQVANGKHASFKESVTVFLPDNDRDARQFNIDELNSALMGD